MDGLDLDLAGRDLEIVLLGAAAAVLWLAAASFLYASRHPLEPPVGPPTLELGPEPPALAGFLVHDFRVPAEAVAATVIDLAARRYVEVEQRGVGVFFIRLREGPPEGSQLRRYEHRVLEHLHGCARHGVVPAAALTTGPEAEAKSWRQGFDDEVVWDARVRGLSRNAVQDWKLLLLVGLAGLPMLAAVLLQVYAVAVGIGAVAYAIVNWIRSRHPQRETEAGLEAASRWLSVREELASNEVFGTYTPLTVPLWNRLLAYGAALGVASGASRPLPLGAESDTDVWSSHGGRWRPVRVRYPRFWPPGWGLDPRGALLGGIAVAVVCGFGLYSQGMELFESAGDGLAGIVPGAYLVAMCLGVVVGIGVSIMAVQDEWSDYEVTGPILRLRAFGEKNDDRDTRYYVAVDDGSSREILAWRLGGEKYAQLRQGQMVTAAATRSLGKLRWIEPAAD